MASLPKYSLIERERRFLVDRSGLGDLLARPFRHVHDTYIENSLMRLRQVSGPEDGEIVYKLCKKYEPLSPSETPITNIYLSLREYEVLANLGGRQITKRRYGVHNGGRFYSVDVFEGVLEGLVLAEADMADSDAPDFPAWIVRDVTADRRFTGGELSRTSFAGLANALSEGGQWSGRGSV